MADFEWYRSFVAIYQAGTVSAAATYRAMTQPGISQHLAALEKSLDCVLFERKPRQMIPTVEGKRLYTLVVGAVEQLERLSDPRLTRAGDEKLVINIGAAREYFYTSALRRIAQRGLSRCEVHVTMGETRHLIRQLEAGNLDVVIASQQIDRRAIRYTPLEIEDFVLIAPSILDVPHNLDQNQRVSWLEAQTWIAYAPDLPIIRRYWQDVFERRPNITPILILPDLLAIIHAVGLGIGLSAIPRYLCEQALQDKSIMILWEPDKPSTNQLYIAALRDRIGHNEVKSAFELLRL